MIVIHWPSYIQSLVRRGEILFSYDFLDVWDVNLDKMNENLINQQAWVRNYHFWDNLGLIGIIFIIIGYYCAKSLSFFNKSKLVAICINHMPAYNHTFLLEQKEKCKNHRKKSYELFGS